MNGWIKVHRALAEHHVASDPSSLSVWVHLLLMANHREVKRQINGRVMVISAGQLIASRKSISAKTGVNESKVERVLKMLQSEQLIEQRGTSKFRLISITNWTKYQLDEQDAEQQVNSKRTAGEQQVNTPGEVIPGGITQEGQEGKEKNTSRRKPAAECDSFNSFWKLYPKKTGKKDALKAWIKIAESNHEPIMQGLFRHMNCQQWKRSDGEYIPNPATWLNGERWNDEVKQNEQRAKQAGNMSAVEQVRYGIAERERERQGVAPQYAQQEFIDGEFSRTD